MTEAIEVKRETTDLTPIELLRIAVSQGADVEKLERLMLLQERFQQNQARMAFNAAMKQFKANPPEILKNKKVSFGNTHYRHATLDHVCDVVTKALSEVGISHSWKVSQDKDLITVACVLTHEMGHSEQTQLQGVADTSGSKNAIQAVGSTVSYLSRYTLLAACGLAAAEDTDGKLPDKPGIDADKETEYLRQMSEVETVTDLEKVFKKAYKEAMAVNDMDAMRKYIAAKDTRKKEMEDGK